MSEHAQHLQRLEQVAQVRGLLGCALVDGHTGMVIHHMGQLPDMVQIGEAAVEFWRLSWRLNAYFAEDFGAMHRQVCFFKKRLLALIPWAGAPDWLLVCIGEPGKVDWEDLRLRLA